MIVTQLDSGDENVRGRNIFMFRKFDLILNIIRSSPLGMNDEYTLLNRRYGHTDRCTGSTAQGEKIYIGEIGGKVKKVEINVED